MGTENVHENKDTLVLRVLQYTERLSQNVCYGELPYSSKHIHGGWICT
jgi:hypothetical protein